MIRLALANNQYTPYYRMGRKSLAQKIFEETEPDNEKGTWLVLYDFKAIKPSSKFWTNQKRIQTIVGEGALIQYSVFKTQSKRGALTAVKLAQHYGANTEIYKAEKIEPA